MTADRAAVALVLAVIIGGAWAGSWVLYGLLSWVLDLIEAWRHR